MLSLELTEEELEKVKEEIVEFIRTEVEEAGVEGAVIGLSGGIDSSLTFALAVEALGSSKVKAMVMPEAGLTPPRDVEDATELAKKLGVEYEVVEINPMLNSFKQAIKASDFALANLKPRIRMCLLYIVANSENRIVLGTGNRTELLLGYFTKYGDGGVDILPIGGLYKTQVRALARYIGIPESIIEKPPSAGLWKGQTDEGEIGMSYDMIDRVLYSHFDLGMNTEEIAEKLNLKTEDIERIFNLVEKNAHKRRMPRIKSFE